ncbi:MAG: hypothetical protein ACI9DC_003390 [Gammaproteobacteria bacterium]
MFEALGSRVPTGRLAIVRMMGLKAETQRHRQYAVAKKHTLSSQPL